MGKQFVFFSFFNMQLFVCLLVRSRTEDAVPKLGHGCTVETGVLETVAALLPLSAGPAGRHSQRQTADDGPR